jgi:hypothetical protein
VSVHLEINWHETPMGSTFDDAWVKEYGLLVQPPRRFMCGPLAALVGREPVVEGDLRWHISVSCAERLPHWHELVDAAHALRPGVVFVIGMPPRSWWINVHPYCLHLWETTDAHLVSEWRANARGDRPT